MLKEFLLDDSKRNQWKKSLYEYIHKEGPISKADLLERFHVPPTTMTRFVDQLEVMNVIEVQGYGKSSGGRRPVLYGIRVDAGYLCGVEIARTHVKVILVDMSFTPIGEKRFVLTEAHTPEVTINEIVETIQELMKEKSITIEKLLGIGVGAVGPLNREKGIILHPGSFPAEGWHEVPIISMLQKSFSVSIIVNNGASTAALAEHHVSETDSSILYCISGYGIRCGYIHEGKFLSNKEGDASSFGHIIVDAQGRDCFCGKKGCLTAYASFGAILEQRNGILTLAKKLNSMEDILSNIENQDEVMIDCVMKSAYYYGIGIANMVNSLHPDVVLLHGRLINEFEPYYREVVRIASEHVYLNDKVQIKKGALGEDATAIGGAIQLFRQFLEGK
ncbi:ROK family protein [Evansella sp. AB-rgal1]|uniref:ROK family protein n=1 Tax=Evansella sp. AB-rgal1 TaxID=3242696 RepID=UPI00359EFBA4